MIANPTRSYFIQRVTGVIMLPLVIWILFWIIPKVGILILCDSHDIQNILRDCFGSSVSASCMVLFVICSMYHSVLGIQSIILDYVSCNVLRKICNVIILSFAAFITVFLSVFIMKIESIFDNIQPLKEEIIITKKVEDEK